MKTHNHGFTLIELLIALMIFSIVSIAALGSVNHMMRAREQQVTHHEANQALDRAYAYIFQDMTWFVNLKEPSEETIQFVRTQTSHVDAVSTIQYRLIDGELFRLAGENAKQSTLLLNDVDDIRISWLLTNNQWVSAFDPGKLKESPVLLRIQFNAPHLGEVTWVFATPHL